MQHTLVVLSLCSFLQSHSRLLHAQVAVAVEQEALPQQRSPLLDTEPSSSGAQAAARNVRDVQWLAVLDRPRGREHQRRSDVGLVVSGERCHLHVRIARVVEERRWNVDATTLTHTRHAVKSAIGETSLPAAASRPPTYVACGARWRPLLNEKTLRELRNTMSIISSSVSHLKPSQWRSCVTYLAMVSRISSYSSPSVPGRAGGGGGGGGGGGRGCCAASKLEAVVVASWFDIGEASPTAGVGAGSGAACSAVSRLDVEHADSFEASTDGADDVVALVDVVVIVDVVDEEDDVASIAAVYDSDCSKQ